MKIYIEAIEQNDNPEVIPESYKEEALDNIQNQTAKLAIINARLNSERQYKKRVHYCLHEEGVPCIEEEIVNDTIKNDRRPDLQNLPEVAK